MAGKKTKKQDSDILSKAMDALMPDVVKKLILVSIGGVMLTDETIRKILSDLNLSKEIVSIILQQSNKAKDEIYRMVKSEFHSLINRVNIENEIRKIMQDTKVRVQLEIDFESKKKGDPFLSIQPKITKKIKKRQSKKDKK